MVATKIRVLLSGIPFRFAKELQSRLPLHYEPVLCEGMEKVREIIPVYRSDLIIHISAREKVPLDEIDTDFTIPCIILEPRDLNKTPEELDEVIMKRRLKPDNKERNPFQRLLGTSPVQEELRYKIQKAAATELPVFLYGEPGTGKDTIAHILHQVSSRRFLPFLPVNCAAVPKKRTEFEFFGCVKGAYVGAEAREGFCQKAGGGTLYLDSVDDFHSGQQATLLRFLATGQVQKVGGRLPEAVNLRVICASNGRLEKLRPDFFHKVNVLALKLAPLRERTEDIPALARHFLDELGYKQCVIDKKALMKLQAYDWPGNLRQLKNTLQRACIFFSDVLLKEEHLEFIH